jgi:hypothetical protein
MFAHRHAPDACGPDAAAPYEDLHAIDAALHAADAQR